MLSSTYFFGFEVFGCDLRCKINRRIDSPKKTNAKIDMTRLIVSLKLVSETKTQPAKNKPKDSNDKFLKLNIFLFTESSEIILK